MKGTKRRSIYV